MSIVKPLDRRTFLRGAGVAIALPFLEAMLPSGSSWASEPRRFGCFIRGNGLNFPDGVWTPNLLNILKPFSSQTTFMTGISNAGYGLISRGKFDNHHEFPSLMSGQPEFLARTSVDQVLAPYLNPPTLALPVGLHVSTSSSLSMKDGVSSTTYESPYDIFNLLTAVGGGASPKSVSPFRQNVLDASLDSIKSLRTKLGSSDKAVLDQHLAAIEQMQKTLNSSPAGPACNLPSAPNQTYTPYQEMPIIMDLLAMALKCDLTRVVTMCFASSGAGRRDLYEHLIPVVNFPKDETWVSYHSWTHNRIANCLNDNNSTSCLTSKTTSKVYMSLADEYEAGLFARFLTNVNTPGFLDNSGFVFGSGGSPGGVHSGDNIPFCLVGKLGGTITPTGQIMNDLSGARVNNVWLSMMKSFGLPINSFGSADSDYYFNPSSTVKIGA